MSPPAISIPDLALEIMKLFKRFNEVGVTVVIATHDVHLIDQFAARRIVSTDGRVTGTPLRAPSPEDAGALQAWFARHAQTLVGSLGRIVQHPFATLMTMAVVAVALALPLFLNLLLQNTRAATANWNEAFDLSVYMDKKAGCDRAQALAKQLRRAPMSPRCASSRAEQALAEFRDDSGFGKALDALTDNPLPNTLIVTPTLAASTPQGTERSRPASPRWPTCKRCSSTPNG